MLTSGNLLGLMNVFPAESALSDKMLINGPHRFRNGWSWDSFKMLTSRSARRSRYCCSMS